MKEHGYYKEKGVVEKVASKYLAQIAMLKSGDVLQVKFDPPFKTYNGITHHCSRKAVSKVELI